MQSKNVVDFNEKVEPCPSGRAPGCPCHNCEIRNNLFKALSESMHKGATWDRLYTEMERREEEELDQDEETAPVIKVHVRYSKVIR